MCRGISGVGMTHLFVFCCMSPPDFGYEYRDLSSHITRLTCTPFILFTLRNEPTGTWLIMHTTPLLDVCDLA